MMDCKFGYFLAVTFLTLSVAQAESVTSGSKYPIVIEVYKGKNSTCNAKEGELSSAVKGVTQTYKDSKGNIFDKFRNAVSEVINSTMKGSGCELVGKTVTLEPRKTINVPVGTVIVAFKDPFVAWEQNKKIVNPIPAVCKVQAGKGITLKTRHIIGGSGDAGLSCK